MQETYIENIKTIIKNKTKLEKQLEVKITNRGKLVFLEGKAEAEYIALKVLEAIDLDFPIDTALLLKEEDIEFHKININCVFHINSSG